MFKKIMSRILGETPFTNSISTWIIGFSFIIFIRSFFEIFSSSVTTDFISSASQAASLPQKINIFLFFVTVVLLISLTVALFTKVKNSHTVNLSLYGLPIIFLAPIIDFLLNHGKESQMDYIVDTGPKLLNDFLTFFGVNNGATIGMRIEILIILCIIGLYVWLKRRSFALSFGAVFVSYILIFIIGAAPGIIYTVAHLLSPNNIGPSSIVYLQDSIISSNIPANMLYGALLSESSFKVFSLGIGLILSQFFFVISFVVGILLFLYTAKEKVLIVLRNMRFERILFYVSLLFVGMVYAGTKYFFALSWVDLLSLTVLVISWFSACMFAIHTNDIVDIEIDSISNPNRPLPKKEISVYEMRDIGVMWLIISLIGSYTVGYYSFYLIIIFTSAYYVYSAPPFRLKQIPILSSFLISLACLTTILAGFFFISPDKMIGSFPILYTVGILVIFTLAVNIRDIKDVEGDRAQGIQTLPVFFFTHGRRIVGLLFSLSFLLMPFFFPLISRYFLSLPAAILAYWLCVREPYSEKYIFVLYFLYVLLTIVSLITLN